MLQSQALRSLEMLILRLFLEPEFSRLVHYNIFLNYLIPLNMLVNCMMI